MSHQDVCPLGGLWHQQVCHIRRFVALGLLSVYSQIKENCRCVLCPGKMGIDVTALGLTILLTSQQRGREREGERNPIKKRSGIGYFLMSIKQKAMTLTSIPILLGQCRQLHFLHLKRKLSALHNSKKLPTSSITLFGQKCCP